MVVLIFFTFFVFITQQSIVELLENVYYTESNLEFKEVQDNNIGFIAILAYDNPIEFLSFDGSIYVEYLSFLSKGSNKKIFLNEIDELFSLYMDFKEKEIIPEENNDQEGFLMYCDPNYRFYCIGTIIGYIMRIEDSDLTSTTKKVSNAFAEFLVFEGTRNHIELLSKEENEKYPEKEKITTLEGKFDREKLKPKIPNQPNHPIHDTAYLRHEDLKKFVDDKKEEKRKEEKGTPDIVKFVVIILGLIIFFCYMAGIVGTIILFVVGSRLNQKKKM